MSTPSGPSADFVGLRDGYATMWPVTVLPDAIGHGPLLPMQPDECQERDSTGVCHCKGVDHPRRYPDAAPRYPLHDTWIVKPVVR